MDPLLVALVLVAVAWGVFVGAVALQARLLRELPALGLRTTAGTAGGLVTKMLALVGLLAVSLFLALPALPAAALVLAIMLALSLYKTLLVELALLRRMVRAIERGDGPAAARTGLLLGRVLGRHKAGVVVANFGRSVAATLALHTGPADAERLLSRLARRRFPVDVQDWQVALDLAQYRIAVGSPEGASAALEACALRWIPPHHEMREQRTLLTARIDAATGEHERALETATSRQGRDWDLVRAHAHAAAGRLAQARLALVQAAEGEGGKETLRLVEGRGGPASGIARAMLQEDGSPYR